VRNLARVTDARDSIHHVGEKVRGLYVVVTGSLENSLLQQRGRRYVLDYVAPGGAIGLIPALDQNTALTHVRAHDDTVLVLIPGEGLRDLLQRRPELLFTLALDLCDNVRRFGAHIERLAMLPLRERVAHALMSLASRYGQHSGRAIDIGLKVSQDDLAGMLSVSRQRVNGELRRLVAVRRAPGGVEECDVVRVGELRRRRSRELAETDGQHRASQGVLERLPRAEIGRQRDRPDDLRCPDRVLTRRGARSVCVVIQGRHAVIG